jgi:hypothetical protein
MFNRKCDQYWSEADYPPVQAILDYWCGNTPECREAKKIAIISACERGEIKYARTDGKDFRDPVLDQGADRTNPCRKVFCRQKGDQGEV